MNKIKRDDNVYVLSGKDKGKTGQVRRVFPKEGRAIVNGINMVRRHMRPRNQQQVGGIIDREAPISLSNLMLICKSCNRRSRTGIKIYPDGKKVRYCKACQADVD